MNPAEFQNISRAEDSLWWYRGMNRMIVRLVRPYLGGLSVRRVFEAGCGTGFFAQRLQREFGWKVFASDIAPEGLRFAAYQGLERLTQADLRRTPFRDGCFDVVVSLDVVVHLPRGEEGEAFRELARITAPQGLLIVRVSALDILRSRHSQWAGERQRFTRGRLIAAAGDAGLEVLRCTYANSLLMPVALAKFRVWEPLTRQAPASGVSGVHPLLNSAFEGVLKLETALLESGLDMPAGQSLVLIARRR
jgi:SAM-dependent methyltransferase